MTAARRTETDPAMARGFAKRSNALATQQARQFARHAGGFADEQLFHGRQPVDETETRIAHAAQNGTV